MGVADMAQKLDGAFTQDALLPVDDETILFEDLEDRFQVLEMFLLGRRRNKNKRRRVESRLISCPLGAESLVQHSSNRMDNEGIKTGRRE